VIRLPVRAEEVTVTKQVVMYERVVLRRREIGDIAPVEATVRRERLQVATAGPVEVVEGAEDDLGGTRGPTRTGDPGQRRSD
jgi:stress response protein YsnF